MDELVVLRASLLPGEFQWRGTPAESRAWEDMLQAYERGDAAAHRGTVHAALGASPALGIWLLASFPGGESPTMTLSLRDPRAVPAEDLHSVVAPRSSGACGIDTEGEHRVFSTFLALQDCIAQWGATAQEGASELPLADEHGVPADVAPSPPQHVRRPMRRAIFWSHHLIAPTKRRQFHAWCAELTVWGLVRVGYPGFLYFEGEADDIRDMVTRVKNMQWHALSLRVDSAWEYEQAPSDGRDPSAAALLQCAPAAGAPPLPAGAKLRTTYEEIEDLGTFITRLRNMGVDEQDIADACHIRTGK
ncbi:hypothetical protein MSPP1_002711 [Malassezia sp. CBS 17886]|nr:hypothetical protein MSPP1_002711 [Malassezia sp. CBS 17886]